MSEGRGEFRDVCGPVVAIVGIPALVCSRCGAGRFSKEVLTRLSVILDKALDVADAEGLPELEWVFTRSGPPEVGGFPEHVRVSFAGLRDLVALERLLVEAAVRAAHQEPSRLH